MFKIVSIATLMALATILALAGGCGQDRPAGKAKPEGQGGHKAAHGGCLNVIGACAVGHAEVRVEGDALKLWFVGGENDTGRAVRVPDTEIVLAVKVDGEKEARSLTLKAKPNQLLEEKAGDCSCFEGQADWLTGVKAFEAIGSVNHKGKKQALRIEYPRGYDPDDEPSGETRGHGHEGVH
jgi:hypothetical protein